MTTTVTLNAAMDRTLVVPNFLGGRRHRASSSMTLPGGRGVTIARALRGLGVPVIATGMVGGLTGENIVERLTDEGILNDFVRIAEPSRTSTAVVDPVTGAHTEINEYGPRVTDPEIDRLVEKLRYLTRASGCVVFAGSMPRDVPADLYQSLVRGVQAGEQGRSPLTIVAQPHDPDVLRAAISAEPTLTVVEQREAEDLVGNEFTGTDDFLIALDRMARAGAQSVVITHDDGLVARVKLGRTLSYWTATVDAVDVVSPLGFTDCVVAGLVHGILEQRPMDERIAFGVGTALANHRVLGAGRFEDGDPQRLAASVSVTEVEPIALDLDN